MMVDHGCQLQPLLINAFLLAATELLGSFWPEGFNSNTPKEVLLLHEVTDCICMDFLPYYTLSYYTCCVVDRLKSC
jgi:hypothetical protein